MEAIEGSFEKIFLTFSTPRHQCALPPPSSAGPDFYDVDKGHEIQWTSMPLEPFLGLCGPIISRA